MTRRKPSCRASLPCVQGMGVEDAVAKRSGAMCEDLGAAASATGGAAEEPLRESTMRASCRMLVDNASEQHVQTNQRNTGRRLQAAISSEELLEAANN